MKYKIYLRLIKIKVNLGMKIFFYPVNTQIKLRIKESIINEQCRQILMSQIFCLSIKICVDLLINLGCFASIIN